MHDDSLNPPKGLVATLYLGSLAAALDIAMVGPAIPAIQEAFALDERQVAWVLTTFVLFNLIGVPVMAWLADTLGRRFVFSMDLGLFAVGALVVALSASFPIMIVGRALQGVGAAGIFPVASAVIGDTIPVERRGKALGILGSVFGVAFILGPSASGLLLQVDWRLLFILAIPLALTAVVLSLRVFPADRRYQRPSFDAIGLVLFTAIVAAAALALNSIDAADLSGSLRQMQVWLPAMLTLVCVPLLVVREQRAEHPVVRPALFKKRQVQLAVMLTIGAGICEAAMIFSPSLAIAAYGVSKSAASFMFLPLALAVVIGSPVFGSVLDRVGARTMVVSGSATVGAGLLAFSFAGLGKLYFYSGAVLIGSGLAMLLGSSLNYVMLNAADEQERTTAQGFVTLSLNTGLLLGGALIGAIVASSAEPTEGYRTAFVGLVFLAAVMAVLASRLTAR